jgi:hypothetical protein
MGSLVNLIKEEMQRVKEKLMSKFEFEIMTRKKMPIVVVVVHPIATQALHIHLP